MRTQTKPHLATLSPSAVEYILHISCLTITSFVSVIIITMLDLEDALPDIYPTFKAAIRSVGTACTLASIGVYLHRRGFVAGEGKKTLALIAQQVTIPLLLFTKIIFCNQDWSSEPCPDITKTLEDVWLLLFWPMYVVAWGLVVGWCAAKVSRTPPHQVRAVLVACSFSNCTGLPITLLSVVHANFPSTSDLGRIDPTLFLSVYLLMYPILQWGIGGWLLAPEVDDDDEEELNQLFLEPEADEAPAATAANNEMGSPQRSYRTANSADIVTSNSSIRSQGRHSIAPISHNVLNNHYMTQFYKYSRRGIDETDASMYVDMTDLTPLAETSSANTNGSSEPHEEHGRIEGEGSYEPANVTQDDAAVTPLSSFATEKSPLLTNSTKSIQPPTIATQYEDESLRNTASEIFSRCLQPPVVGAMAGVLVASTPLRGIFVDLKSRSSDAPLQWFFDGLYSVGQAAVPLNMMILGSNVSASLGNKSAQVSTEMFSTATMLAIVLGKMVVMPMIGVVSACVLQYYILDIPDAIEGSFYLVLMIVFITPTANNGTTT
jgi:predicted permease